MKRRQFLSLAAPATVCLSAAARQQRPPDPRPNVIFILADDLGRGELGCYGQKKIRTPNLDRLAADGMRFTQAYSGSPVCAPARCSLLTGRHMGHAAIRDNFEVGGSGENDVEGQLPLPASAMTLARMLQETGYLTAVVGKWGLGGPDTTGVPSRQGFDHWFGYLCQRRAHNCYPKELWSNGERIRLRNEWFPAHQKLDGDPQDPRSYDRFRGEVYAPDLFLEDALQFIRHSRTRPFFLYFATNVPHAALQVPDDSLREYEGAFPETPYGGEKNYLPNRTPRATYAAMVTRMDRDIGRILALLKQLGLEEKTLVFFASDNGPTFNGGTDSAFFESAAGLRGLKTELYEGGIRVPLLARWPGRIKAGAAIDHPVAFWDILPTIAELTSTRLRSDTDGISLVPTLLGQGRQQTRDFLYWEYHARPSQAVRIGNWKGVRPKAGPGPSGPIELYDLRADPAERKDLASRQRKIVARIAEIMAARTPSEQPRWNFGV